MSDGFVEAMNAGVAQHRQGRFEQARGHYERALAQVADHPDALNLIGLTWFQSGGAEKALEFFRQAIEKRPDFPDAHLNLGSALASLGRLEEAIARFETAALQAPTNANAHYNLGLAYRDRKALDQALPHLARALELVPQHLGALMTLGSIHAEKKRFTKAEEYFRLAIVQRGDYAEAYLNLGNALNEQERFSEALAAYDRALALKPMAKAHLGAGIALVMTRTPHEAAKAFEQALVLDASLVDAHVQLANVLCEMERFPEAIAAADQALALAPDPWEAHLYRGSALTQLEQLTEAMRHLERSLALQPLFLPTRNALSNLLMALGQFDRAETVLLDGLGINPDQPDLRWNLALCQLGQGKLESGWANLHARWQTRLSDGQRRTFLIPKLTQPRLDLTDKSVLVWAEQGIGDIITYASALPDLIALAKRVVVEVPEKLVALFQRSFPKATVRAIDGSRDAERTDCDFQVPVGDLFALFRPSLESFVRADSAYLLARPDDQSKWSGWLQGLGPGLKIGIGWRSTYVTPVRLRHFFADLMAWRPILAQAGAQFIVLQPGEVEDDLLRAEAEYGITLHRVPDLDLFNDLDGLSSLLTELDLVISNGTALALQAAAQGVPTWMFLLKNAHWDLMGTEGLPWLPAIRVFARKSGESWDRAVDDVAQALRQAIAQRPGPAS
ncbi:MAG: tetratricopeptide repeat protein [Rhodospirillales bacterium]|nr:tetratricopeptide repeat protein [Rhodospirillales bacterium]